MISSHPTAQKLHHMAILNKPLRPGDKSLLLISHSSTDSPCPSGTAPQRLRFPILRPWRGKWGLLSLTSHQRAPPPIHTHPGTGPQVGSTFPKLLGFSLALEAALSRQGGTGGGHSCREPLKSVG